MNRESIFDQFRTKNLKLTPVRKHLIDTFLNATQPLSYDHFKNAITMNKATFYRNMHVFENAGFLRKIESDHKKWYFELAITDHAHFICNKCHTIECLEPLSFHPLSGYTVDTVIYKGTCSRCNA